MAPVTSWPSESGLRNTRSSSPRSLSEPMTSVSEAGGSRRTTGRLDRPAQRRRRRLLGDVVAYEMGKGLCPVDRLGDPGRLDEAEVAESGNGPGDRARQCVRGLGRA